MRLLLRIIFALIFAPPLKAMETFKRLSEDKAEAKESSSKLLTCAVTRLEEECEILDETAFQETLTSLLNTILQKKTSLSIEIIELPKKEKVKASTESKSVAPYTRVDTCGQLISMPAYLRHSPIRVVTRNNPPVETASSTVTLPYEDREVIQYFPHFLEKLSDCKPMQILIKDVQGDCQQVKLTYAQGVQYCAKQIRHKAQEILKKMTAENLNSADAKEAIIETDEQTLQWQAILKICHDMVLSGKNHPLWLTLMVDSLAEIYKEHSFSKIHLAVHLNIEGSMITWIREYIRAAAALQRKASDASKPKLCNDPELNIKSQLASSAVFSSPLIAAIVQSANDSNIQLVNFLMSSNANVNQANTDGETPLMFAALSDNVTLVSNLIKRGAEIDKQNGEGFTALHLAVGNGKHKAIQALLQARCNTEIPDYQEHFTPLLTAIYKEDLPAVKLLLAAGANINHVGDDEEISSPLMYAFMCHATANNLVKLCEDDEESDTKKELRSKKDRTESIVKAILEYVKNDEDLKTANNQGVTLFEMLLAYDIFEDVRKRISGEIIVH